MDNKATSYKLQLGYQFNPYIAIEGGYVDIGTAEYSGTLGSSSAKVELSVPGWMASVVGILPLGSSFSLFAKAGRSTFAAKVREEAGHWVNTENVSRVGAAYGVGASYKITKEMSLRAEYERFDLPGDDLTGDPRIKLFTLGVAYKFCFPHRRRGGS